MREHEDIVSAQPVERHTLAAGSAGAAGSWSLAAVVGTGPRRVRVVGADEYEVRIVLVADTTIVVGQWTVPARSVPQWIDAPADTRIEVRRPALWTAGTDVYVQHDGR